MTIKEQILMEGIGYKGHNFSENYYFSQLSKGFVKDYKKFGNKTIQMYEDFFGDEYAPIFESMAENIEVLSEATEKDGVLLFEQWGIWTPSQIKNAVESHKVEKMLKKDAAEARKKTLDDAYASRWEGQNIQGRNYNNRQQDVTDAYSAAMNKKGSEAQQSASALSAFKNKKNMFGGEGSAEEMGAAGKIANKAIEAGAAQSAAEAASETAREAMRATGAGTGAVPKGFLANVWNSIKTWGKGLMEKFPGLGKFLKNGVSWVTDPANAWKIAAGAGAAALGAIALRIKNKKKREAFLAASKQKPV